jgi:hypothetical protein
MSAGHETRDADVGSLFLIALILLLSGVVICLSVWALLRLLATKDVAHKLRSSVSQVASVLSEPRLETQPAANLQEVRAHEEAQLNSSGWINRDAGVVPIPIDRAMELIVERGLPDVGANQTPLQLMQARPQETRPSPPPQ